MKTIKKTCALFALTLILGFGTPVFAQESNPATTNTSTNNDDDDDDGAKWGLVGLLGLLGLIGMKRRENDPNRTTRVSTNR